jgi:uncharacterized membrane protein (DUF485 family)
MGAATAIGVCSMPSDSQVPGSPPRGEADWDRIIRSPLYRQMVAEKMRFVVIATLVFLVYYFALLVLVGYWPELMATQVIGVVNIAYLFALSQFFMAWFLAYLYMRIAGRFDHMTVQILRETLGVEGRR